jgi:hypothetical protein
MSFGFSFYLNSIRYIIYSASHRCLSIVCTGSGIFSGGGGGRRGSLSGSKIIITTWWKILRTHNFLIIFVVVVVVGCLRMNFDVSKLFR